jgi:hypothetical protein
VRSEAECPTKSITTYAGPRVTDSIGNGSIRSRLRNRERRSFGMTLLPWRRSTNLAPAASLRLARRHQSVAKQVQFDGSLHRLGKRLDLPPAASISSLSFLFRFVASAFFPFPPSAPPVASRPTYAPHPSTGLLANRRPKQTFYDTAPAPDIGRKQLTSTGSSTNGRASRLSS